MGFFSSRKDESVKRGPDSEENSVVRVIRSRFYGKPKPRNQVDPERGSFYTPPSAQQALSPPAVRQTNRYSTQLSNFKLSPSSKRPSELQVPSIHSEVLPSPPHLLSNPPEPHTPKPDNGPFIVPTRTPKAAADNISLTLAQRLNDLAKANAEGLLNDEDYRMLRKDLFERLATTSPVPSEASIVPVRRPRSSLPRERPSSIRHSRVILESPRPSSVRSRNSATSSVRGYFGRGSQPAERTNVNNSDASSFISSKSGLSNLFRLSRALSRKGSQSSINTDVSQSQADVISIASRRTDRSHSEHATYLASVASRSNAAQSIRRMATPPSSFHARMGTSSNGQSPLLREASHVFDDENLVSSQDIHKEILAVEVEKERLMDSFSSLELATLTRRQRNEVLPSQHLSPDRLSAEPRVSLHEETLPFNMVDSDAASMRSHWSFGTSHSASRSISSKKTGLSSGQRLTVGASSPRHRELPPVPALPVETGSWSPRRRALPAAGSLHEPIAEDDSVHTVAVDNGVDFEDEMADLKRRREDVRARYDARLQYLRAKLKGAQLHEKLVRK